MLLLMRWKDVECSRRRAVSFARIMLHKHMLSLSCETMRCKSA